MLRNLDALDASRGLASLAIAFYAWSQFTVWADSPIVGQFYLFVDFFFVFTGFLIAEVYRDHLKTSADLRKFVILRLAKLYPIQLFFLAPLAGIELMKLLYEVLDVQQSGAAAFAAEHLSLSGLLANLTLTQTFGVLETPGWNEPSWYVATEFWVSFLFAIACLAGLMRSWAGRISLAIIAGAALVWMLIDPGSMKLENGGAFAREVYSFGVGVAVHSFLRIGQVARKLADIRRKYAGLIEAPLLVFVVLFIANADGLISFAAPPVFALLIIVFADGRGTISQGLRTGVFRILGKFSYPIYMSHFLFILPMRSILEAKGGQDLSMIASYTVGLYLALTIVIAIITEKLVEAPTRNAIRSWRDGQTWSGSALKQPRPRNA